MDPVRAPAALGEKTAPMLPLEPDSATAGHLLTKVKSLPLMTGSACK
jgi:hypothetical protein